MTSAEAQRLAKVMRAFLSRPERWNLEEYEWWGRRGWRLTLNGTIDLDRDHAEAVDPNREPLD